MSSPPWDRIYRKNKKYLQYPVMIAVMVALLFSAVDVQAQQTAPLSLPDAVAIAMGKSPELSMAVDETQVAKASVTEASAAFYPHIGFTENATIGNDPVYVFGTRLRQGRFSAANFGLNELNSPSAIGNFMSRLEGKWNVFDSFASTAQMRQDKLVETASQQELTQANIQALSLLLLRRELDRIAAPFGARVEVSEVPPGPLVLQTLVAEVYGPDLKGQIEVARQIKQIFRQTSGVVDVNWYVEDPQPQYDLHVDLAKAAAVGVSAEEVTRTVEIALHGADAGLLHSATAKENVPIQVRLDRADRSSIEQLQSLKLPTAHGGQVSLAEVTILREITLQSSIYRKNMRRVIYVTGDLAGSAESSVYAILTMNRALDKIRLPQGYMLARYNSVQPDSTARYSMKWDGE